ncbi:MAG: HEAT repeat domain-containing protein, partial [Phycisphaerae bacterium]|nr:HEAT repeat domain-containing protein [Phycisphaerae bacterium]
SQTTNPHVFDLLLKNLDHRDESMVAATAEVLGLTGDPRAAKPLYACYQKKRTPVRVKDAIKFAMSSLEIEVVLPILKPCLADSMSYERYGAMDILAYIAPVEAVDVLVDLLSEGVTAIREKAAETLVKIGKPAVPALLKAAKHSNSLAAIESIKILGKIPDPRCVTALTAALRSKHHGIAQAAEKALKNTDKQIETAEGTAIESPTVTALLPVLRRSSTKEKVRALGIISSKKSDPRVFRILMKATSNPDKKIRATATQSLGNLKDKRAIPYFFRALQDLDGIVRKRAERSLMYLVEPSHVPALVRLLKAQGLASPHAACLLGKIGTPATWQPMWEALYYLNKHTSRQAAQALRKHITQADVKKLDKALRSPHRHIRGNAILLYKKIGGKEMVKPLLILLQDKDISISNAAADAFENTDDYSVLKPLLNQAIRAKKKYKPWRISRALSRLVVRDFKPFIKLLQSKDFQSEHCQRRLAAHLLGKTNNKQAHVALRQFVEKHDLDVTLSCYQIFNDLKLSKGIEDCLIDVMNNHGGGYGMASCYLNSSNSKLRKAAIKWGKKNGYRIITTYNTHTINKPK